MKTDVVTLAPIGMNKDNGPLVHNPQLAFDIKNMRVVSNGDTTGFSLESELGNTLIITYNELGVLFPILGNTIGTAILNDYLVLFTHETGVDRIYMLNKDINELIINKLLFEGDLNFSIDNPIETEVVYENENILKVYWVDGLNQPRMINIVGLIHPTNTNQFDFVPKIIYDETITIDRLFKGGIFPSGTIQYALTYFNRNGHESNIFYISPIYNLTHSDRGASQEENTSNSFKINITNADVSFEYIRIYSIVKTSLAATPIIKKVLDLSVRETSSYILQPLSIGAALNAIYAPNETILILGTFDLYLTDLQDDLNNTNDVIHITNGWIRYTSPLETTLTGVDDPLTSVSIINDNSLGNSFQISYWTDNLEVTETLVYQLITIDNISGNLTFGKYGSNIIEPTPTNIVFTDTNTTGEIISPTHLLYLGGTPIIADTLCVKDNTLFLGNITLNVPIAGNISLENNYALFRNYVRNASTITNRTKILGKDESSNIYYGYKPESLINESYTTFKNRETYRLGIQLQHETGVWSEPIFIKDHTVDGTLTTASNGNREGLYIRATISNDANATNLHLQSTLVNAGFKKYRPVIVYPSIYERSVIAQGVINPTIFNVEDRYLNAPSNISSWYFRPMTSTSYVDTLTHFNNGAPVEFRHHKLLPPNNKVNCEILTSLDLDQRDVYLGTITNVSDTTDNFVEHFKENFAVDLNLVTFHSPDIEFDESLTNLDRNNLKFRIIGLSHFTGFKNNIDIITETAQKDSAAFGFTNRNSGKPNYSATYGTNIIPSIPCWNDKPFTSVYYNFVVYTWLGCKSLSGHTISEDTRYGLLGLKKMANLRYSGFNTYLTTPLTLDITPIEIFNSDINSIVKIQAPVNSGLNYIIYQGNVDKIVNPNILDEKPTGPIIQVNGINTVPAQSLKKWKEAYEPFSDDTKRVQEAARIKFKSSPHGVFAFDWGSDNSLVVAPSIKRNGVAINNLSNKDLNSTPFWKPLNTPIKCTLTNIDIPDLSTKGGGLWIGELYRDIDVDTIFGGTSQSAIEANQWIPAGEAINLDNIDGVDNDIELNYIYGDTYFLRYDCLKTYPLNVDDEETLVEIGSFLLETKVNIDGRYDKNRGSIDNLNTLPSNFNLINSTYTKPLSYFSYRGLNYDLFKIDKFKNTITWTNTKVNSENIDSFTNITMNNILDVNGAMGTIKSLTLFNDSIIGFLDKGIFSVLYNNRVSISTSDGVPIEMASSGKVEGFKYITNFSGSTNKHSIVSTDNGIYYIDYHNKSINLLNTDGNHSLLTNSLTDKLGFSNWIKLLLEDSLNYNWNPYNMLNFKLDYDAVKKDVYINNVDYSLAFSEKVLLFTSFYDYNAVPYMFNVWKDFVAIKNEDNKTMLWKQHSNINYYNKFFNTIGLLSITYLVNPLPSIPKCFNVAEFYTDKWKSDSLQTTFGFDRLTLTDEYLNASALFTGPYQVGTNMRRKFRLWRAMLPRLSNTIHRFVNPYIKYILTSELTDKVVLHNTNIYFNY